MNNLRWISTIMSMFSKGNSKPLGLFRKRKTNKGTMILSIVGIIASAAITAYRSKKGSRKEEVIDPIERIANSVQNSFQGAKAKPLQATFNEFANEIVPEQNQQTKSNFNQQNINK
jgi:hypothetical protein